MTSFYSEHSKVWLSVDCIIFGFDEGKLKILIGRRQMDPGRGEWSLYGGFVRNDEGIDEAANNDKLLLKWQKNGIMLLNLKEGTQVKVFSTDGKMLQTLTAHKGTPLSVTVDGRPNGVYIIKTAGRTFKLLKQ